MKIELHRIPVSEIVDGYVDTQEDGVVGYHGKLNIRPKYQREFIYGEKERNAVIDSINKSYPLNVMYWMKSNTGYELLDGQQRTMSICQYVNGDFTLNERGFVNLTKTEQDKILNYELMIYVCEGNDEERLNWFRIINIAGKPLNNQEIRNATYTGTWLTDAKRYFSKTSCPAFGIAEKLMKGSPINQDYLESVLKWKSENKIEAYMAKHQHDQNANELWMYFNSVVTWVNATFTTYRKQMKGIEWGTLYNEFESIPQDTVALENRCAELMRDDDVTSKTGIYEYLLSGREKCLSIRAFTENQKTEAYERQKGICPLCKKHFEIQQMEADHITPWCEGGKTLPENCQMLCKECNRRKSNT